MQANRGKASIAANAAQMIHDLSSSKWQAGVEIDTSLTILLLDDYDDLSIEVQSWPRPPEMENNRRNLRRVALVLDKEFRNEIGKSMEEAAQAKRFGPSENLARQQVDF